MLEQAFVRTRVIAIVRGIPRQLLKPLITALSEGGISLAEITLNSPEALASIAETRSAFEGRVHIGAGTVLDREGAVQALNAGAEFIVTPNVDREVIELCRERDVFILPGALTPTEIVSAMRYGSKYVKVFPASSLGPGYFHEVLAPLNRARLVAVGGINADNAARFIREGAAGVGVGGALCSLDRLRKQDLAGIAETAAKLTACCRQTTGNGDTSQQTNICLK